MLTFTQMGWDALQVTFHSLYTLVPLDHKGNKGMISAVKAELYTTREWQERGTNMLRVQQPSLQSSFRERTSPGPGPEDPPLVLPTALMQAATVMLRPTRHLRFVTWLISSNDSRLPYVELRNFFIFLTHTYILAPDSLPFVCRCVLCAQHVSGSFVITEKKQSLYSLNIICSCFFSWLNLKI